MSETWLLHPLAASKLHRVHRGVYAVGHPGLSQHGIWSAAVLAAGENAALSHLSVAEFWKVSRWPISVTSVVSTARRTLEGVELHTVRRLDERDVIVWSGIRVTTVARIFDERATRAAMARANGRCNLHRLERALELRAQGSAGTRSGKEDAFLEQQTVEPRVNTKIEVDFHWPDEGRVVEVDGHGHRRRATRLEDARRDALLDGAGWRVERVSR